MRVGLERAGWDVLWANDMDPAKFEMYKEHFGDAGDSEESFVLKDVHQLDAKKFPKVALATSSFPCTDLSLAGSRHGLSGRSSSAYWGFIDLLKGLPKSRLPNLILLENVTGFLSSNKGADLRDACYALNELGYAVDAFIIDAVHFVPQSRQRLFVVGSRKKATGVPALFQCQCRPDKLVSFMYEHPEIQWRLSSLPPLPARQANLHDVIDSECDDWWDEERAQYLLSQMSPKHREIADGMIGGSSVTYGTIFRRVRNKICRAELRVDGVAGCLRTPKGGSARQILFAAGNGSYQVRLLSAIECARLMGVGSYKMKSDLTVNKALFGFGDAVCVPVVEWIGHHVLNPLKNGVHKNGKSTKELTRQTA